MGFKEFCKRRSLRTKDDQTTRAAELTLKQSIYPICLVTLLFFLWGFSYGLLDTLNKHFQVTLGITKARSSGLQAAYFGAYPLASLGHAAWILRKFGYRAVFIWGLVLYAIGAVVAFPCIKAKSFGGFCAAIFIIGNGLGSLETAANPYITVCGPPKYAEIRINISQAFNGIGTVVAPVLGSYVLFNFSDEEALENVTWIYLSIAAFTLLLAVVFFFSVIPEITDADMEYQAQETATEYDSSHLPFRKQYRLFHAAFAQLCYTGAQVAIASYFINYVTETRANTDDSLGAKFLAGAQGAFSFGRFAGVFAMKYVRPRMVFLVFLSFSVIFSIPAILVTGNTAVAMVFIIFFFESICFPTIVALGMRGLGRHTKRGSGFIVGGVFGGAIVPPLMGFAADQRTTAFSFIVPLFFFVAAWSYAFCVNGVPWYRKVADAYTETDVGTEAHIERALEEKTAAVEVEDEKRA